MQSCKNKNEYNAEKVVAAFRQLKCKVYMSQEKISLDFPANISQFHVNELRLAFYKTSVAISQVLHKEFGRKLKLHPSEMIRII